MAEPQDYYITITIAGNDVTTNCPFDEISFEDNRRTPSYFNFLVQNPSVAPARGDIVQVIASSLADTPTIFYGYVMEVESKKRDNGITKEYRLECADLKIRLQKSVLPFLDLIGTDADIITDLFSNVYPNLDDLFDYTSGIDSFASDLAFNFNNESLLDALNELADKTGASYRQSVEGGAFLLADWNEIANFDDPGYAGAYPRYNSSAFADLSASGGNPGACILRTATYGGPASGIQHIRLDIDVGAVPTPADRISCTNIIFDYKITVTAGGLSAADFQTLSELGGSPDSSASFAATVDGAWHTLNWTLDAGSSPWVADRTTIRLQLVVATTTNPTTFSLAIDNYEIISDYSPPGSNPKNKLNWGQTPDPAPFDLDIPTSDEFAYEINLFEGSIDDFNSITVVGGKETVAVDWIYDADGQSERINLEVPMKSLVVYKNTGTDTTPSWTAQSLGTLGTDELTGDGGTKDVLYDPEHHWLLFDTNPVNLTKSVRITATIEKPIRVRVENIASGEETYATVIYNDKVTSQEEAISLGNSELAKRNSLRRLNFKTYEPGLKVGQEMTVTDSARGLSEALIIQKISTRWLGGTKALFDVECGNDEGTSVDTLIAGIDKKAQGTSAQASLGTTAVDVLLDENDEKLTDASGGLLYEV